MAAAARSLLAARALPAVAAAAAGGAAPYCTVARQQQRRPPPDMRSYLWSRYREAKRVTKGERGRGGPAAGRRDPAGPGGAGAVRPGGGFPRVGCGASLPGFWGFSSPFHSARREQVPVRSLLVSSSNLVSIYFAWASTETP